MSDFLRQLPDHERHRSRLAYLLHLDLPLLTLLLVLSLTGLVVLYSANGREWAGIEKQVASMVIGYMVLLVMAQVSPYTLQRLSTALYIIALLLLLAVIFKGSGAKGAKRWLDIPGLMRFQPSEMAKLTLPLILATYFELRPLPPSFKHILWALAMIVLPATLIAKQPDLGSALLVAASGLVVLFMAGIGWRYILGAIASGIPVAWAMWHFAMHDYQRQRILMLLNPEADKFNRGWNIIQSTTAIGSGGFFGKGWLHGTQSHLDFLPEGHTDFIIAVFSEEFGFVGVLFLLALYLAIIGRCLWICYRAEDSFGRLMGTAITFTFFVYVFVNMGMVSGILPVVGVPLPMISYGGTAIVTLMTGFGVLMAIATDKKRF